MQCQELSDFERGRIIGLWEEGDIMINKIKKNTYNV